MDSPLPNDVSRGNSAAPAGTSATTSGPSDQTSSTYPPLTKKQQDAIGSLYKEGEPKVIEKKEFQPPPEVKEYVSEVKKEEAIKLPVPIEDEYGQVLMEAARPTKPKIILPLDDQGIAQGLKQNVVNSVRWLVTWCLRLVKMFPARVFYKPKSTSASDQQGQQQGQQNGDNT